jgi:penicillin-binding protein 1A
MARGKGDKPKKAGKKAAKVSKGRGLLATLVYWSVVAAIWSVIAAMGLIVWYSYDLPDVSKLDALKQRPSIVLTATDGSEIARFGSLRGEAIRVGELPRYVAQAVVAIEDRRFYSHFGLDVLGLARAMMVNLIERRVVQGGSTISQQLAKNVFLTPERTIKRKVQEVLLALWLEANFSKEEILTLYLNRVYLGAGAYGIDAAARRYFGKPAHKVTLQEAAMIAGLLKAPSRYAPTRDLDSARQRAGVVLSAMVDVGDISEKQAAVARKRPARLRPPKHGGRQNRYFADWIMDRLPDYVGTSERDLVVVTTLDPKAQASAEAIMQRALSISGNKLSVGQGALLALGHRGEIRAMIGGRDYVRSQFNRATQARRQPGSAFKAAVYLAGLEAGLRPDTIFVDRPIKVEGWSPRNYTGKFAGRVTMAEALSRSINTVAVTISEQVGRKRVADTAWRLGITGKIPLHPSIALGTANVSVMEIATAYAPFANGGYAVLPHGIVEIRVPGGPVLYRRRGSGRDRIVEARHAAMMSTMLARTISSEGTGKAARLNRPAAGKTGTSQDYRDAWFVGYSADLIAAVWLGNDDGSPMKRVTGGGLPARLWRDFMTAAHKGKAARGLMAGWSRSERQIARRGSNTDIGGFFARLLRDLGGGAGTPASDGLGDEYFEPRRHESAQ